MNLNTLFIGLSKTFYSINNFFCFSLLVGEGAHKFAVINNIITVDPLHLVSGIFLFFSH